MATLPVPVPVPGFRKCKVWVTSEIWVDPQRESKFDFKSLPALMS